MKDRIEEIKISVPYMLAALLAIEASFLTKRAIETDMWTVEQMEALRLVNEVLRKIRENV